MNKILSGLTTEQVAEKHSAGLNNQIIDSVSPSYPWIVVRNIFNLINIFILPLLILLALLGMYKEVIIFATFAIINSLVAIYDEIRIKRRLDQIKVDFAKKITVMRNGKEESILANELVEGDIVIVREGDGVPTDGKILKAEYLQLDESLLTGESNYIAKAEGEGIVGGGFVVTGQAYYQVTGVGANNYINVLGTESKNFSKQKSSLEKIGDRLTILFVLGSFIFGAGTYFSSRQIGYDLQPSLLALLTAVALIIPQTLIFLFTFSFSISVLKLSKIGVLVQRGSAIESLANLDILCLDKTGTITTNDMKVIASKYWSTTEAELGGIFSYMTPLVYGKNKTFSAVSEFFTQHPPVNATDFDQSPFTSKTKMAKAQFQFDGKYIHLAYGAFSSLQKFIAPDVQKEVEAYINEQESQGRRLIVGVIDRSDKPTSIADMEFQSTAVWIISLKEELNAGIRETLNRLKDLGIELKIISGDGIMSVQRVLQEVGMSDYQPIDLSAYQGSISEAALEYNVFARAKPEDKLTIIKALQSRGKLVGMVGDGVNDVLALKLSNLSIAMESGAKIARDVADIVLLNNDFRLVPQILFEGQNIIANLIYMNKLFIAKTLHAIGMIAFCISMGLLLPILPAPTLIYSFLTSSMPSYVIAFSRRHIIPGRSFFRAVMPFAVTSAIAVTIVTMYLYQQYRGSELKLISTIMVYATLFSNTGMFVHQVWHSGYVTRWYSLIGVALGMIIPGIIATLVPFLNFYYEIVPLSTDIWLDITKTAALGTLGYIIAFYTVLALQRKPQPVQ
jgi:cation-transporting P-type ATPase E